MSVAIAERGGLGDALSPRMKSLSLIGFGGIMGGAVQEVSPAAANGDINKANLECKASPFQYSVNP